MSKDNSHFFDKKSEWAVIKDSLLQCYLVPYFQKLLHSGKQICYIDCFAGMGKFLDGNPGSPLIALETRKKCLELSRLSLRQNAIKMAFIESDHANELASNIIQVDSKNDVTRVIQGKFKETINKLLINQAGRNVFLYIDPYGIKSLDMNLLSSFSKMGFSTFEMLINFNSFGLLRNACCALKVSWRSDMPDVSELIEYAPNKIDDTPQSVALVNSITGGDYWRDIVLKYKNKALSAYQAERELVKMFKSELRKHYKYVLDMPISLREGQLPKYRMIHVSNHEDGCFLMAQNMQNRKKELYFQIQSSGQLSFLDKIEDLSKSLDGILYTRDEIDEKLQYTIRRYCAPVRYKTLITDFVNDNGLLCDFNFMQEIIKTWEKRGFAIIVRNPAYTQNGKPTSFWEEKSGKTLTITWTKK